MADQQAPRGSRKRPLLIVAIVIAVATFVMNVSIVTLGTKGAGSTVVVLRKGELAHFNFFDSDKAFCRRSGVSAMPFGAFFCEGRVAIVIGDRDLALVRFGFSPLVASLAK